MTITIKREIQRRLYRVEARDGQFFTSLYWDESQYLNQIFQSMPASVHPSLAEAQAAAIHIPGAAEWTQLDSSTWITATFICDGCGRALTAAELEEVRRRIVTRRPRISDREYARAEAGFPE